MAHAPQFLKLVNEAKKKIKETNVADVKRRIDAGEKFLLVDTREDSRNFSPASMRRFTSATLVSLIFFFASLTSFRNCGAWAMRKTPVGNDPRRAYHRANGPRLAHGYSGLHSIFEKRSGRSWLLLTRRGLR